MAITLEYINIPQEMLFSLFGALLVFYVLQYHNMASACSLASAGLGAYRTPLLYSQFTQPARTNQSINIIQSWQGKTVTSSLLQTELHTQPHNYFWGSAA
ncbi:MAG: hypothetical protein MI717_05590, partial [Spirochaetales bacterium]|nr:hypothetical protein [Spirochaetales bacterium]